MISYVCNDKTLEVTIDVGKGNLLSLRHLEDLSDILNKARADCSIQGVVITGAGHSFSTGLDLLSVHPSTEENPWRDIIITFDRLLVELFSFPKPFVAAINGHSVGAGFMIQLCADFSIVTKNDRIKMGLPELSLGLTIDPVMTHLARHGFPSDRVLQYFLYSSELLGPERALQIGVVDEIVTSELLMSTARDKIVSLLRSSQAAFLSTKQTLRGETIRKMEDALVSSSCTVLVDLLTSVIPYRAP